MDQAEQQLEQLEREYESNSRLVHQYHTYNQYILAERAAKWQNAIKKREDAERQVNELTDFNQELTQEIHQLEIRKQSYSQQKEVAEAEKKRLEKHEVWNLEEDKKRRQGIDPRVKGMKSSLFKKMG